MVTTTYMTVLTANASGQYLAPVHSVANRQYEKGLPACRRIPPWASFSASARPVASCGLTNLLANAEVDCTVVDMDVVRRYACVYGMKASVCYSQEPIG